MRILFSIIFFILILTLIILMMVARKSSKPISNVVAGLMVAVLVPVVGNMFIIVPGPRYLSLTGNYIYSIGMDMTVFWTLKFTMEYCVVKWKNNIIKYSVWVVLLLDIIQLLINPITHHAFHTETVMVDGYNYYGLVPNWGLSLHRVICYIVFAFALLVVITKLGRSPKIYIERYAALLVAMVITGGMETFYVFSRTPIDLSMTALAVFAILAFYLALVFRPMRLLDRMLAGIASDMQESLFFFDLNGKCIWINEPGIELTGVREDEFYKAHDTLVELFGRFKGCGDSWACRRVMDNGDIRYYMFDKHDVTDDKGNVTGTYLRIRDNTEEQLAVKREMYKATHDMLTGLYTREYLYEEIKRKLANHDDVTYYIVFIDIMNFKIVNDIFGADFGDKALVYIAGSLKAGASPNWVYGRLVGDTFGALIPKNEFDRDRVEKTLSEFVVRDGNVEHQLLIHLGVYEVMDSDTEISVMFDRAHLAMNRITDDYQVHVAFYDNAIRTQVMKDQQISLQLKEAIVSRQIVPYLQPIVDQTGRVVGAEALARWIHPAEGFMQPASFIPVFERNGMIVEIDRYMWRCACEILSNWKSDGNDRFISINISPKDFYFMDVPAEIKNLVNEYQVDPSKLRIEITETAMMNDADSRMEDINKLRECGFIIEMDDFGSGYSSLNLLKDMPVDVLKIDMEFLRRSKSNPKAGKIVQNIIALSEDLDIISLTEGVEDEEQYRQLSDMGCRLFQGYYFAKPMTVEDFERYCG